MLRKIKETIKTFKPKADGCRPSVLSESLGGSSVASCCGKEFEDSNFPVYWNPYNKVVQCHACGMIWEPKVKIVL